MIVRWRIVLAAMFAGGCQFSDAPAPAISTPTTNPARLATTRRSYWTTQPAEVTVHNASFDRLWGASEDAARAFGFRLDRQDRRAGVLTTEPVTGKQVFEFWRRDTGNLGETLDNSLDSYRRSIRFRFDRIPGGYAMTPRVIIERYTQAEQPVASSVYLGTIYGGRRYPTRGTRETDRGVYLPQAYWYATGRDYDLENQIAQDVLKRIESR